jgi:hypothetical protein
MIHISFGLINPWGRPFDNLWNRSGLITNYMAWEVELCVVKTLIGFEINYTRRQDHAGFTVELTLFGRSISFQIYDTRHWDYTTNTWKVYD